MAASPEPGKGQCNRRIDIDTHQLCSAVILRYGQHCMTCFGIFHKCHQADHDYDAGNHRNNRHHSNRKCSSCQLNRTISYDGSERFCVCTKNKKCYILEKVAGTDCCNEYCQFGGMTKWFICHPLNYHTKHRADYNGKQDRYRNREAPCC